MEEFENDFYHFDKESSKLKFYSDEFEKLISNYYITLDNIELEIKTGNIICYVDMLFDYSKLDCEKFLEILKDKIPYIENIILQEDRFTLIFNVKNVELF